MKTLRVYGIVLLMSLLVASLCGCAKEADESQPEGQRSAVSRADESRAVGQSSAALSDKVPPEADAQGVRFGDMLASWESGKKEDAVKQLLLIRWDEPALFANVPLLNLSQDELDALPRDERTRMLKEYIELVGTFKDLNRHCRSVGENAQASGDTQTAKAHYEATLHLGEALTSPKLVSSMQLTGKALVRTAEEKLSTMK